MGHSVENGLPFLGYNPSLSVINYLRCQIVNCTPMAVYLQLEKRNFKIQLQ